MTTKGEKHGMFKSHRENDFIGLLLGILATWRVASLLYREAGPFEVFERIRNTAGVKHDTEGEPYAHNQIGKMLCCFWCTSVWAALPIAVLQRRLSPVIVLAYSAGAIFLGLVRVKLERQ